MSNFASSAPKSPNCDLNQLCVSQMLNHQLLASVSQFISLLHANSLNYLLLMRTNFFEIFLYNSSVAQKSKQISHLLLKTYRFGCLKLVIYLHIIHNGMKYYIVASMCVIQVFLSQTKDNSRVLIQFIGILKVTVQMPVLTTKTNRSSFLMPV